MNQQLSSDTIPTSYVRVVLPMQCRQVRCLAQHRCSNGTISAATTLVDNSFQSACFVLLPSHRPTTQETLPKTTPSIPQRQTSQGYGHHFNVPPWIFGVSGSRARPGIWLRPSSLYREKSSEMPTPIKRFPQCMRQHDGEATYTTLSFIKTPWLTKC